MVSVTVVEADGAVFVTVPDPATVNESSMAVPVMVSLNVSTMVLSAVLSAVNVGVNPSVIATLVFPTP